MVRGHWAIENQLHWQLDVTFGEDQSRLRKGHADFNFRMLRRTALSWLKNDRTRKLGIKNKRLAAGCNEDYLEQVLFGSQLMVRFPWRIDRGYGSRRFVRSAPARSRQ